MVKNEDIKHKEVTAVHAVTWDEATAEEASESGLDGKEVRNQDGVE